MMMVMLVSTRDLTKNSFVWLADDGAVNRTLDTRACPFFETFDVFGLDYSGTVLERTCMYGTAA